MIPSESNTAPVLLSTTAPPRLAYNYVQLEEPHYLGHQEQEQEQERKHQVFPQVQWQETEGLPLGSTSIRCFRRREQLPRRGNGNDVDGGR